MDILRLAGNRADQVWRHSGYVTPDGIRYGSDLYFVGGDGLGINPPDTKQNDRRSAIAGDPGLYDTYREGAVSYRVPVPNGRYRITAHFLEPEATSSGMIVLEFLPRNGKAIVAALSITPL